MDTTDVLTWWGGWLPAFVMTWWGGWLPAFVLTCVIEVPIYLLAFELFALLGPRSEPRRRRLDRGRAILLALGLNLLTHPVFWAVALRVDSSTTLVAGEIVVATSRV